MKKTLACIVLVLSAVSCTMWRGVFYGSMDIDDYKIFPQDTIHKSDVPFHFITYENTFLDTTRILRTKLKGGDWQATTLDSLLANSLTASFLIIRNDTILFEKYYKGFDRSTISTIFSVSKSITSLLTGIAVDEGYIESVNDPVTKYLPELKKKDPMFGKLTIEHLLNMRTGLKFKEEYGWNPFRGIARLYYGTNQQRQIKHLKFKEEPGMSHYYNSMATTILGVILERATGKPLAQYAEEKVWKPLGMEYNAQLSLDDKRHRSAKAFGGFSTNAIDLAKIGRLYLHKGNWNGKQIVDTSWIERSTRTNYQNEGYQYGWYKISHAVKDSLNNTRFFEDSLSAARYIDTAGLDPARYLIDNEVPEKTCIYTYYEDPTHALGVLGQVLYFDPRLNLIMVRLGPSNERDYYRTMEVISRARLKK